MPMAHTKKANLPVDTPMVRPTADDIAKGQTVYYPVKSRNPGDEHRIIKYRAARVRKVEHPVILVLWWDSKNTKPETLYINDIVVPEGPIVETKVPKVIDTVAINVVEAVVAKQPDKPGQIRSVAPMMGVARNIQETGVHNRSLIAVVNDNEKPAAPAEATESKKASVDSFEEWMRMGTELVHPDIENELEEARRKQAQFEAKLKEIDTEHLSHIRDLEAEIIRAKSAHHQDRSFAESRVNHFKEVQMRLENRRKVLTELKKLM